MATATALRNGSADTDYGNGNVWTEPQRWKPGISLRVRTQPNVTRRPTFLPQDNDRQSLYRVAQKG